MDKPAKKLIAVILKQSFWIISAVLVVTIAAITQIPRIKFDNSVDAFFDKNHNDYKDFQAWKNEFGSGDIIIVGFRDNDIFTEENLKLISAVTKKFESVRFVDKVTSIGNVNDIIGSDNEFIVRPFLDEIPSGHKELERLKQSAIENPLYLKNLISADGKTTAIIVELMHMPDSADTYKKNVILDLTKILEEHFPKDKKYYISGLTAIEYFLASYMQRDLKTFLPLVFLIIIAVLIFSFRSFIGVILPLSVVILSLIWTLAFFYLCGYSINNITTVIPPIMLSIALLEGIHFVWELIRRKKNGYGSCDADKLITDTIEHLFMPCLLTNITTVIGFFVLLVTQVPPMRQLGLVSGIGVFFSFILTFTFLPAIIKQFGLLEHLSAKRIESKIKQRIDAVLMRLTKFSDKFKAPILTATVCIIAVAVWQASKVKTETSVLEYFRKDSRIYTATTFIEDNLSGIHSLNVSLKTKQRDYFKEPQSLLEIERLQNFLNTIPEVDKTISVADYLKEINKSFHNDDSNFYVLPDSKNLVGQYLLLYDANDLDDFVNSQWSWTTVRIRLKEHSTVKLKKVITKIDDYLKHGFGFDMEAKTLGQTLLEVNSNNAVAGGQIQSLGLALLLIFGMMFISFRSFTLGMASILPNVFPLLLNFGLMGFLAIRLDSVTAVISDIGIGIIVDDTIHLFHSFAGIVRKTGNYEHALYTSFSVKGSPTIITSTILIFGFGSVSVSNFVPTFYFGLLSALLIFNGLLSEFILSPALLMLVKPKFLPAKTALFR